MNLPYLIAINLTRRCNLFCEHCYLDAEEKNAPQAGELNTEELSALFNDIAAKAPGTIIVLTGGEPLLRKDIFTLIQQGNQAGLRMVVGTNGTMIDPDMARLLSESGVHGLGISIEDTEPAAHEKFRGANDSWRKSVEGMQHCLDAELHVQMHTTLTQQNVERIESIALFARERKIPLLNFFFLVCVGRGKYILDITPEQYEVALKQIAQLQKEMKGIMIQARCAPHFKRVLYQDDPESPYTRSMGYDGGGCLAVTHYCRIDPVGNVTPCPYMENVAGNIRDTPFWDIWENSPLFNQYKGMTLQGRCGDCEYIELCGGCRARAQNAFDDFSAEDPSCTWQPESKTVIKVEQAPPAEPGELWTPEALERLKKIPLFLRKFIRRRLEEKAKSEGAIITPEFMSRHREQREKEMGFSFDKQGKKK